VQKNSCRRSEHFEQDKESQEVIERADRADIYYEIMDHSDVPRFDAPRLYAFDVDETLEISDGPISVEMLRKLCQAGHIIGLCGNWALFVRAVPAWHHLVSFLGPIQTASKADFLGQLRMYIPASDYIMVGNDPATGLGNSPDREMAAQAGWRFIREADFAAGVR
jgi:hypothetical protein